MVLFTKVTQAHFKRMQERPSVKKRLAYEKEGDEGLPRQLRVKQRSLTMVWNRALSKNCRDIKVCSWPLTVLGYVRCSVDHRSIGDKRPLEPLEHAPSDGVNGKCRRRKRGGLVRDRSRVRRFHVNLGHPLGHHEPSDRFLH